MIINTTLHMEFTRKRSYAVILHFNFTDTLMSPQITHLSHQICSLLIILNLVNYCESMDALSALHRLSVIHGSLIRKMGFSMEEF